MSQMTSDPREIRGLSAAKINGILYIDPEVAVFPNRCLYTNVIVESLTPTVIWNPESIFSLLFGNKKIELGLPISEQWFERRAKNQKMLKAFLIYSGLTITGVCLLLCKLPPEVASAEAKGNFVFWSICGAIMALIGIAWTSLKGTMSDPRAIRGGIKDGKVTLVQIHRGILADLPDASKVR
ncbi:MAG: hypothetical protein U0929_15745 [Planctomycetaceae bacterium]